MSYGKVLINDTLLLDIERVEIRGGELVLHASGQALKHKKNPTGIAAVSVYGVDGVLAFSYTMDLEDALFPCGKGGSVTISQPIKILDIGNQPIKMHW
jgi:hypothetical protein